jgi:tRNA 2-thiocytidine biosynthesis protein TtcA
MRLTAPEKTRDFKALCKEACRAVNKYDMLHDGDSVALGLSGGEDSLMLMHVMEFLRRRGKVAFSLHPVTVDMSFATFDIQSLLDYCQRQGWELNVVKFDGQSLITGKGQEDQPCAICSRLRRGQIHRFADEQHCNVLALGHHLDDVCVSFLMSLFHGGGLKTMGPNVPADSGSKRLIRPFCLLPKSMIHAAAVNFDLPKVKSCPYEEQLAANGDRAYLERLLITLEEQFPHLRQAMLHSLGDVRLQHLFDLNLKRLLAERE